MARSKLSFVILRMATISVAFAALLNPSPASASLGGDVASVEADRVRMQATLETTNKDLYSIREIHVPNNVVVREFVSQAGTVFAVVWQGAARPDLRQLLGAYFDSFAKASQAKKAQRVGRGPLVIEQGGLVVEMGGHARSFFGRAYDPRTLPPGFPAAEIQ
jgi:hypothetical protein